MDGRDGGLFEVVSEVIINLGFGGSFGVYNEYDKCRFLWYISDVTVYVGLSFDFPGYFGCGNYVEVLFQEGTSV